MDMNKLIFILSFSALLTSCLVGPNYKRPSQKLPQAYALDSAKTDSITNLKWWEVYKDTVLNNIIKKAIDQNLDLKIAVARVEQTKAILGFNKANMLPSVDYSARARVNELRNFSEGAGVIFPTNSYALLGNVSWEIDLWGKLRHANRAAYADVMASEENRKAFYISMIAQIAELYFQLRGLDERLVITQKTLEGRKEYLHIITLRFDKGEVAELDKLQAEQLTASSEAEQFALERDIIRTENALNLLIGQSYAPINRGLLNEQQQLPLEIPSGLPSQLLERRPDIRVAEQQLIAQTEKVGVAVAMRFPSLSLTGFLGVASPQIDNLFQGDAFIGSIAGQLAGPLFRFGQNKRRVESEKALAKQLGYSYEKTVLSAFAEVENSLTEIRTYREEFSSRSRQTASSEKSLMLSKALYDNGYTSFLQVLDAERELYDSQLQKSIALQNQLTSSVRLYKALGGGW